MSIKKHPKFEDRFDLLGQVKFNDEQMLVLRSAYRNKLNEEQIKIIGNPKTHWKKMKQIILGFINGLSLEEGRLLSQSKLNSDWTHSLRKAIQNGLNIEQSTFLAKKMVQHYEEFSEEMSPYIICEILLSGCSIEILEKVIDAKPSRWREWENDIA